MSKWLALAVAFVVGAHGCGKDEPAATLSWKEVATGIRAISDPESMEGRVLFYEERHGLREEMRLVKVAVAAGKLQRLLGQLGVDELKQCAKREFPAWSRHGDWKLPDAVGIIPCGSARLKGRSNDVWSGTAFVTERARP